MKPVYWLRYVISYWSTERRVHVFKHTSVNIELLKLMAIGNWSEQSGRRCQCYMSSQLSRDGESHLQQTEKITQ